jgi:uncharacterized repeat protein (TIGR01451 family)
MRSEQSQKLRSIRRKNGYRRNLALLLAVLIFGAWELTRSPQQVHAQAAAPRLSLSAARQFDVSYKGPAHALQAMSTGASALSMAAADLDGDAVTDLAVGLATPGGGLIAIHHGNHDAFAPQSEASFWAMTRGQYPSPYLPQADLVEIHVRPDFLAAGDLIGPYGAALAAAASGGNSIQILSRGASGKLAVQQTLTVPGSITAMSAHQLSGNKYWQLAVGVHTASGSQLLIYTGGHEGVSQTGNFPLSGDATSFVSRDLDSDGIPDLLVVAGGQIAILHSLSQTLEPVSVPYSVASAALGRFLRDRDPLAQIALLATDGSLHILAESGFDSTPFTLAEMQAKRQAQFAQMAQIMQHTYVAPPPAPPRVVTWKEVESYSGVGAPDSSGKTPLMFRTRVSSNSADDLLLIGTAGVSVLAHPTSQPGQGQVINRTDLAADAVAALPVRVQVDARQGVVYMARGRTEPSIVGLAGDPTYTVNRTDDPAVSNSDVGSYCMGGSNDCSLREAVVKINNARSGAYTIMIPASYTITLTQPRVDGTEDGTTGTLDVGVGDTAQTVNITGGSQTTTIIQGGSSLSTSVDKVFSFNQDINAYSDTTVSLSNLTIQNGKNKGTNADAEGGYDQFGGGFDCDTGAAGTAYLTLTDVTVTNNSLTEGYGAGFSAFNTNGGAGENCGGTSGTGTVCITGSTISNNVNQPYSDGSEGAGGGIEVTVPVHLVMSSSFVTGNKANPGSGTLNPFGGGILIYGNNATTPNTTVSLHGVSITGNTASGEGGGIMGLQNPGLIIDTESTVSNNSAGGDGGGIYYAANDAVSFMLMNVTITGNTSTDDSGVDDGHGGGIYVSSIVSGNVLTMQYSRLAGNSAQGGVGDNLALNTATVSVPDNWWGAASSVVGNQDPETGTGPTIDAPSGSTANYTPYIVLSLSPSPSTIKINDTSTLTASVLGLSNDTSLSGTDLAAFVTAPVTFASGTGGSISTTQPVDFSDGGSPPAYQSATSTFQAGSSGASVTASATLDNVKLNTTIVVLQPPSMTMSFNPTTVKPNVASTLTFTITNGNTVTIDASFTDTLPTNMQVASTPSVSSTCQGGTGAVTAAANSGSISYTTSALAVGTCSITVNVIATVDNTYNDSVTIDSSDAGNATSPSTATLTVINPPTLTKSFNPTSIQVNASTTMTITLSSSNTNLTLTGVGFTDTLPSGLSVASSGSLNSTCSGTASATTNVSLSGASLSPGASCTVSVSIKGTATGSIVNTVTPTSTNGGTATAGSATLTVVGPPTITKSFGASTIPLNTNTTLSFTISNPNTATTTSLSGVAFTDNLPSGLTVASPNGQTGSCGSGTITATGGGTQVSLSGGTLAGSGTGATCTFAVNVTGITAGSYTNTTGAVTSNEGGTGLTASASISVEAPPVIAKSFSPTAIAVSGTTSLTFTITNPTGNPASLTGVGFTDTLPAGLTVTSSGPTSTCGGSLSTTAPTSIVLSGATVTTSTPCTFSVTVTGAASGAYTNITGNVSSSNGGPGGTATANLTVALPPMLTKSFNPTSIPLNATTTMTITVTNPNSSLTLTGVGFSDNLPSGMAVASPLNLSTGCTGTPTTTSSNVSLSGASLSQGASCSVIVTVQGTAAGSFLNMVAPTSSNGGTGIAGTATLTVIAPPTISKAFELVNQIAASSTGAAETGSTVTITTTSPHGFLTGQSVTIADVGVAGYNGTFTIATVPSPTTFTYTDTNTLLAASGGGTAAVPITTMPLNGTATLAFTLTNPNSGTPLTGVGFTDMLPTGLTVTSAGPTMTCGGSLTVTSPVTIALSGATVETGTPCTFSVPVTGAAAGSYTNTTGAVTSNEGGTGLTASASLNVEAPPSISKTFTPTSIAVNGTTSLTFTITNPTGNPVSLTGVGFTDTLPTGLTVTSASSSQCSGTLTVTGATGVISLSGATVAVGTPCQFSVTVTGATAGSYTNTTGAVTSNEGGTGNTGSASLTVLFPPSIVKSFNPTSVPLGGTSTLTLTITNPNASLPLTGVAFTDTFPSGMVLASNPNASNNGCGGSVTANGGAGSVALTNSAISAGGSCSISVSVQGNTAGTLNNSVQVTSTNAGTGNTGTASLTVEAPPTIAKSFAAATIALNASTNLTFTITNPPANPASLTGIAFTDTLPTGLTVTSASSSQCGGGALNVTAPATIALSGATVAVGTPCQFSVSVTGAAAGSYTNVTGNVTSSNGGTGLTATASLNVEGPPSISKAFGAPSIALNATTSLTFTITNPTGNPVSLTGVGFTDMLPTGLTVTSSGPTTTCGGSLTVSAPVTIALANASIAVGTPCQFSVTVTGATSGSYTNTTLAVTSTNGGTGNTATATLTVASPPSISKSFNPTSVPLGGTSTLTLTVTNPNASIALTGVAFTDTFPTGMVLASNPAATNTCTGSTLTAVGGASSVSLSGESLAGGGTCSVSVVVQGNAAGTLNNSVQVTSTNAGTGNTGTASLTVEAPPTIAKAFGAATIALSTSTNLTFTISNPAGNPASLTGVGFTDILPTGLTVTSASSSQCGGTLTVTGATGVIALSGATVGNTACSFSVSVTGAAAGSYTNTTGAVSSANGGTGLAASASLNVEAPPLIAKAFGASGIALNATTSLTFTITNPTGNPVSLTGVGFTDPLPTGLTVASGTATPCGGTLTVTAPTSIALSGATVAAGTPCTFSVTVTGAVSGIYTNITGSVSSTNGGTGNTATAGLTVASPPQITKSFGVSSIPYNGTTSLTFTIGNPNASFPLTGVAFTDSLPAGLVVSTPSNLNNTCGGTATAVAGSGSVSLSGVTLNSGSCIVSLNVTGASTGVMNNFVQATSTNAGAGNTANATLTVTFINVSSQVRVTQTGFVLNRLTGIWSATMTVTNTGGSAIAAPIEVVMGGLSSNATMYNYSGYYNGSPYAGNPYITVLATGSLAPGASLNVTIEFTNPSNGSIEFTPVTFSGKLF